MDECWMKKDCLIFHKISSVLSVYRIYFLWKYNKFSMLKFFLLNNVNNLIMFLKYFKNIYGSLRPVLTLFENKNVITK